MVLVDLCLLGTRRAPAVNLVHVAVRLDSVVTAMITVRGITAIREHVIHRSRRYFLVCFVR